MNGNLRRNVMERTRPEWSGNGQGVLLTRNTRTPTATDVPTFVKAKMWLTV